MEIDRKVIKDKLNIRKETLDKHLAKFDQLKKECKWSEAWSQLLITLNYADGTLKYVSNLLKDISRKVPLNTEHQKKITTLANRAKQNQKKMIIIPKRSNIH